MRRLRGNRTQTEVAEIAGIPRSVWNRYEKGTRLASPDARRKVALGLGCSLLHLEREMWEIRFKNLAAEEAASGSQVAEGPGRYDLGLGDDSGDLLLREIRGHIAGLARHLEALVLVLLRNRSS